MAGQNDFLIFDENNENILTQANYASDTDRANGFRTGLARSIVTNKVLHQTSMVCHALGELAKDNDQVATDTGNVAELKTALKNALGGADINLSNLSSTGQNKFNGKADVDLTNVNATGTSRGAGWAMPSDKYINLTLGASGSTYTAPASGWVYFNKDNGAAGNWIMLLHNDCLLYDTTVNSGNATSVILPIKKGNTFQAHYSLNNHSNVRFRFYYAQGSESEAN